MTTKTAAKKATQTAAAAPAAKPMATVTPLVTKTKIEMARGIADQIRAADYVPAEGSSPRKDFISRCVKELEMTEKGASTYWQNLRNEAEGEGLYKNSPQPTGERRGRKPNQELRLQKAAAKVTRLQSKVADDMKALQEAQSELVTMATGEAPVAPVAG